MRVVGWRIVWFGVCDWVEEFGCCTVDEGSEDLDAFSALLRVGRRHDLVPGAVCCLLRDLGEEALDGGNVDESCMKNLGGRNLRLCSAGTSAAGGSMLLKY